MLQTISDKMLSLRDSFNTELKDLGRLCNSYGMRDEVSPIAVDFACVADRVQVICYECFSV